MTGCVNKLLIRKVKTAPNAPQGYTKSLTTSSQQNSYSIILLDSAAYQLKTIADTAVSEPSPTLLIAF